MSLWIKSRDPEFFSTLGNDDLICFVSTQVLHLCLESIWNVGKWLKLINFHK